MVERRLIVIREGMRPVRKMGDVPLRRTRLQCADCGYAWLRVGECAFKMVTRRWVSTMRWACKNRKDYWRRQRDKVAG